jgi:predicted lipoprotein with Yx(FWY)xxD motif
MTRRETTTRQARLTATARAGKRHARATGPGWRAVILRLAGGGLLIAAGAIHLDLYLTGYRTIPTIGWLFLLQVISAFGLGLAVLAISGGRLVLAGRLAAAAGAGFALATLGGYLLTVWIGLFGFREVRTTAGIVAGVIDVAAFAVLATLALAPARADAAAGGAAAVPARFPALIPPAAARVAAATAAALSVAALALLGVAVAGAGSPAPTVTATGTLKATTVGGAKLLASANGFTLYWFAPDTPATSTCYGTCAVYWPPVTGAAVASPGLPGRIAAITRTGGARQLTYDGHPLYTYIGDTAPGQASGNNLNLNGGLWHDLPVSG